MGGNAYDAILRNLAATQIYTTQSARYKAAAIVGVARANASATIGAAQANASAAISSARAGASVDYAKALNSKALTDTYRSIANSQIAALKTKQTQAQDLSLAVMNEITPVAAQKETPAPQHESKFEHFKDFMGLGKGQSTGNKIAHVVEMGLPGGGLVADKLRNSIQGSSVGKKIFDVLQRPVQGSGAQLEYLSKLHGKPSPLELIKGLGGGELRGLTDKSHILPSQVINPAIGLGHPKGTIGKATAWLTGTAADIALDPTSYLPTPAAKGRKFIKPLEEAPVAGVSLGTLKKTDSGVLKSKSKEFLDTHYKPAAEAKGKEIELFKKPRFTGTATGGVSDTLNPVDFAHSHVAGRIADVVKNSPVLTHLNLSVESPFRDVRTGEVERVPHTEYKDVTVNVPNPKLEKAAAAKKEVPVAKAQRQIHSIRMMLLNTPDHTMSMLKSKGKKITVGDLLETASKSSPARKRDIAKLIENEAVKLFKNKDIENIPHEIQFKGKTGSHINMSMTKDNAIKLFTEGKIPQNFKNYGDAENEFVSKFPLHNPEDLKIAHVTNEAGENVPLHQYLKENKIPVKAVDLEGNEKDVLKEEPNFPVFEMPNAEPATIQKTVRTAKTVYTNISKVTTSSEKLKGAQYLAWMMKHSDRLSTADMSYLRSGGPKQFEKRLGELKTKQTIGNYKTLDQFIEGAKSGAVPDTYIKQIFDELGVKSLDELKYKATTIIKKTGEIKAITLDDFVTGNEKVSRFKGKAATEWDRMHEGVKTPSQIIKDVANGDNEVLARPNPIITPTIANDVNKALNSAYSKNIKIPTSKLGGYNFKSKTGTLRTAEELRVGVGRNLKGWNSFSQSDALRSLLISASGRLRDASLKLTTKEEKARFWKERAANMYNEVMPALQVVENKLAEQGVKIIAGHDESGILMSLNDVLTSLPRAVVEKHLFSPPASKIPTMLPTGVSNAAEPLVTAALNNGDMAIAKEAAYNALLNKTTGGNFGTTAAGKTAAHYIVNEITKAMPSILQKVNKNYAEQSIKIGQSVTSISDKVLNDILTAFDDPKTATPTTFAQLMDRSKEMALIAKRIKAPSDALPITKIQIDSELVQHGIEPGDLAEADIANRIVRSTTKEDLLRSGLGQQKSRVAEAQTLSQAMGERVVDYDDYFNLRTEAGLLRSYIPVAKKVHNLGELAGRAFVSNYGFPDLHDALWGSRNSNAAIARAHRALMSKISKYAADTYGPDAQKAEQQAWHSLQNGEIPTDTKLEPLATAMKDSVDLLFNAGDNSHASIAIRNGLFTDHVNSMMDYYHVPKGIRFDESLPIKDQADVWKSWANIKDPLDTLDRIFAAHQFALTDSTIGRVFSDEFGVAGSRPGFVKITDNSGKSTLHKFIDPELYYPEHIVKQIPYYDEARNVVEHGIKGKNAAYVVNLYDKATFGLKTGFTVLRPGHHFSNLMGDIILNMLGGTTNPLAYRRATRVLSGRADMYKDWDGLKALRDDEAKNGSIPGKNIKVGKLGHLTYDEVWRGAQKQGLLSDYHMIQDLEYNDTQQFGKLAAATGPALNAGKSLVRVAGKTADIISHNMRMAQFIDVLNKTKAGSIADALDEAGRTVRKWHPDGTDLTPFERKYAKRTILFYSWMRKSVPLILQSLLTRPGRALVIPKASFNLAQVMGVNPDSLADPFPQDMLLPSFISDSVIGPQWLSKTGMIPSLGDEAPHKVGVTLPGDPVTSTIDQTVNNPLRSILGSLSPVAKVPIEEATKTSLGTGAPITNQSDYLDQQLPLVGNLANILNKSVVGGGKPQHDVGTSGNSGMDKGALGNFLTGTGIKDYSKLNYKKAGLYELRQKYLDQVKGK